MSALYWFMSGEALQRRLVREIREARTPLTARAPRSQSAAPRVSAPPSASGVAEIRVEGVLTPEPDIMAEIYGEPNTTYLDLRTQLADAMADNRVREIVWKINSPGGDVDGYFALLDDIAVARAKKPMRVEAEEAQSAAYGIAAAAGRITATSRTASFGSVGVATSYFMQGGLCGEVVDITSSDAPDKRPNVKTPEGRDVVVRYIDQLAGEFMSAIASGRGVTVADVAKGFGRGASMLAPAALSTGLIDAIAPRQGASVRTDLTNARTKSTVATCMSEPTTTPQAEPTPAVPAPLVDEDAPESESNPAPVPAAAPPAAAAVVDAMSPAERAELAAFRAERDARVSAERRALVTALVEVGAETPATAWANGAPVARLASEPIDDLRSRVTALRATRAAGVTSPGSATPPPVGAGFGEEALTDFERRDAAKIKDPEARARFVASRLERKQKAQ